MFLPQFQSSREKIYEFWGHEITLRPYSPPRSLQEEEKEEEITLLLNTHLKLFHLN